MLPTAGRLAAPGGAFVTLRTGGRLRGTLGALEPGAPLARAVVDAAGGAATRDPRFSPLTAADLPALEIDIAVIGPGRALARPGDVDPAHDAVAVQRGWHRGVLLPSAAAAGGWDGATYLRRACLHAGLPPRAWAEPGTRVRLYPAEELGPDREG